MPVFFLIMVFSGHMSRSEIVGSYDSSMFSFLTKLVALNNTNPTIEQHKSFLIVARDQKSKMGLSELLTGLHSL